METSNIHDPLHPIDSLFPLREKKLQDKQKNEQSKPNATVMLAGKPILIKDCTVYTLKQENDENGSYHFKIAPYEREQTDGITPPLIIIYGGHVYYSKEHETALGEAIVTQQNSSHPVLEIYKNQDLSVDNETCWHALHESEFHSLSEKLSTLPTLSSPHEESSTTHRSSAKPYKPSSHKRKMPVEQESKAPQLDETSAEKRILENNPGSIESVALKSAEWVDKKLVTSSEVKKEEGQEFLHQINLGKFDEVLPLYKNSASALNKDETEEDKKSKPPSSLPEEDRRQIENMRSSFPI